MPEGMSAETYLRLHLSAILPVYQTLFEAIGCLRKPSPQLHRGVERTFAWDLENLRREASSEWGANEIDGALVKLGFKRYGNGSFYLEWDSLKNYGLPADDKLRIVPA